jgi:hypothetical protein
MISMVDIDRRFSRLADHLAEFLIGMMERRERVENAFDAEHDRTGAAARNYAVKPEPRAMVTRSVGPLHMASTSFYAADQAFGLARDCVGARGIRSIRGFYFPLRKRLIWVWLDYR